MAVHHSGCLHEGMANGRTNEANPRRFKARLIFSGLFPA
jgi:hypothetical protein